MSAPQAGDHYIWGKVLGQPDRFLTAGSKESFPAAPAGPVLPLDLSRWTPPAVGVTRGTRCCAVPGAAGSTRASWLQLPVPDAPKPTLLLLPTRCWSCSEQAVGWFVVLAVWECLALTQTQWLCEKWLLEGIRFNVSFPMMLRRSVTPAEGAWLAAWTRPPGTPTSGEEAPSQHRSSLHPLPPSTHIAGNSTRLRQGAAGSAVFTGQY